MAFCLLMVMLSQPEPLIPEAEIMALNGEMLTFMEDILAEPSKERRLRLLIRAIFDEDFLNLVYDNTRTKTASETFSSRAGNCLSFTNMFIAMARHAGFEAHFQEVYNLPTWNKKGKMVILNRHMNAVVMMPGRKVEVDFNPYAERQSTSHRLVSDIRAVAQYYNNIGAEYFSKGDTVNAVANFQKAIELAPDLSFAWSNLGVTYRHADLPEKAEQAYLSALKTNPYEQTAMVNLASLYQHLGREKEAKRFKKKIKQFRQRNPYYHYQLGQNAFARGQYDQAIDHYRRAIHRKRVEHEFHFALAKAYVKIGKTNKAERSLEKAKEYSPDIFNANQYNEKLARLAALH